MAVNVKRDRNEYIFRRVKGRVVKIRRTRLSQKTTKKLIKFADKVKTNISQEIDRTRRKTFKRPFPSRKKSWPIRTGDELIIDRPEFTGSWRRPKYAGFKRLRVRVSSHSYGADKGQHTFSLYSSNKRIKSGEHLSDFMKGPPESNYFKMKGRNLYPSKLIHWPNMESVRDALYSRDSYTDLEDISPKFFSKSGLEKLKKLKKHDNEIYRIRNIIKNIKVTKYTKKARTMKILRMIAKRRMNL